MPTALSAGWTSPVTAAATPEATAISRTTGFDLQVRGGADGSGFPPRRRSGLQASRSETLAKELTEIDSDASGPSWRSAGWRGDAIRGRPWASQVNGSLTISRSAQP